MSRRVRGQRLTDRRTECSGGDFPSPPVGTSGTIDAFRVGRAGLLTEVATVTGLPSFAGSGVEGIAAV
ncbi:hypothetical protein [Streptomyces adustus]|uniref:hypothetical protein n=1 Tax=Streptomyces adustus TaxID=1609272 RepID=UPI00371E7CA6